MTTALLAAGPVPPDAARRNARSILGERRFRPAHVPRPFAGALRWLGRQLEPIGRALRPVGDFFQTVGGRVVLGILVIVAVAAVAWIVGTRRSARTRRPEDRMRTPSDPDDPRALERAAEQAERDADYATAVRLRFRAGLLRLDAAGVIRLGPSSTSGQVARRLDLRVFDDLARDHDLVAYGGRPADTALARATRDGWSRVLQSVGSR